MRQDGAIGPRKRLRAALPYLAVLAAAVFLYVRANRFEFEQVSGRIGPGAWPKLVLVLLLASALCGIVANALRPSPPSEQQPHDAESLLHRPELYPLRVWAAIGITLGYLLLLPIVGFFLATIVYSFLLIYLGDYRRLARAAGLSLAIAAAFMFLFMRVVYVALPVGTTPFDHLSYALMAAMGVH